MFIIYQKTTLFVQQIVLDTQGGATYTRDVTTYPDVDYDDVTIDDNPTAEANFRGGKAFKVDVHPSPTAVVEITRTQLVYTPPLTDTWASGMDNIVFADDTGSETFKQDFKIEGIHSSATEIDVIFTNEGAGITDVITCTRGQDVNDYTWNNADNFMA